MGRYRSGQTGQTVNLLALRLREFDPLPAHHKKAINAIRNAGYPNEAEGCRNGGLRNEKSTKDFFIEESVYLLQKKI